MNLKIIEQALKDNCPLESARDNLNKEREEQEREIQFNRDMTRLGLIFI